MTASNEPAYRGGQLGEVVVRAKSNYTLWLESQYRNAALLGFVATYGAETFTAPPVQVGPNPAHSGATTPFYWEAAFMPIPKGISLGRSTQLYEIGDGVRRAKAAQMLGKKTINATNSAGELFEVSISNLRSPMKSAIDISNPRTMARFESILNATKNGEVLPPIYVNQGTRGIEISKIIFKH